MHKAKTILISLALAATILPASAQQSSRRDRNDDSFGAATAQQLASADRRLNQIYQRRIADARADDRNARRGRAWYSQEAALRSSERAWITFRDAECQYLTQQDAGSRMREALVRGCLVDQIEERTDELRDAEQTLAAR